MTPRSTRTLLRTVHLVLGICAAAVIYMPPAWTEPLRLALGIVVIPAIVLTGLSMWQQPRLRKLLRPTRRGGA